MNQIVSECITKGSSKDASDSFFGNAKILKAPVLEQHSLSNLRFVLCVFSTSLETNFKAYGYNSKLQF